MQTNYKLYRKRIIPEETVCLKDDVILLYSKELIVTRWNALKPRSDISHGLSAYFIDRNFKVSKIFDKYNQLVYWYCDIIQTDYSEEDDGIIFTDLLLDVIILPDNTVRVLDIDEIADALESNRIDIPCASKALRTLNELLNIIYTNRFAEYQKVINDFMTAQAE